ncbi:MOB kinase activator-like 2 isoform X2 [Sitodiplosis mosellana]|uniref:MOB kinase activator-like 2 isoform X2 n=1 Tax=Sitodiplosis mosellana TaxID=263140 RepID=UPI0024449B4A|nr:MOB kinase activator-like 2 isoform X2 [Sitodiplosis mosellana]XP_055314677.1 MOB kinase activator-like 2 isoform X2 [Sitodiplosis mosellana]XP_055314678.1 MOB kinase activator-like 2 isoform X2 [Sitodiplosis mosellana]XP_055314679.1 MOB kinase activator-like 2 isoform X2 [Sitodiplosis mosellana]
MERLPEYLRDTVEWFMGARNSKNTEKSSVMWLNTIVGRAGNGAASKALSNVRYSSIGLHERTASGQIILPFDVEETVTCFCRKARRKEKDGDQNSNDTKLYLEESVLERKLTDANLNTIIELPAGLDYNEWLASHTLALFEHVNLVYGTISEFCTTSGCPDMTGPGNRMYLWFDEKGKKTRVAAPQYIDYVMTFTQKTVSDESIFPTKYANEFPSSFESIARKILRLLFHVIAHLYAAHFREIALLGLHSHLNLTFAHLTALHKRFNLIESKETDVLRDLEIALRLTDDPALPQQQQSVSSSSIPCTELNSQTSLLQSSTNLTTIHTMSSTTSASITAATVTTSSSTTLVNYSDDQTQVSLIGDTGLSTQLDATSSSAAATTSTNGSNLISDTSSQQQQQQPQQQRG